MFSDMLQSIKEEAASTLLKAQLMTEEEMQALATQRQQMAAANMQFHHMETTGTTQQDTMQQTPFVRVAPKIGRNEPCPCGSGKKYKQCHGKI